ncbi:MAG: PDDEXK nuclease domain-containing protein [Candidatus Omnitrophota bacterium]
MKSKKIGKKIIPKQYPEGTSDKRVFFGNNKSEVGFPVGSPVAVVSKSYASFLGALKSRIRQERLRVVLASNAALVNLYWDIGKAILEKQEKEGWGAKVIDRLSFDLRKEFIDMRGFSPRNLKYMRAFAAAWPEKSIVQEALAQITWYHNLALLDKLADPEVRIWYARNTVKYGWSRNILAAQIDLKLYERKGKAINNFSLALPPADSDMAVQVFKDPYIFDFLGTADTRREKEVEQALVDHIQRFLLELGQGFAFVGRQVHLELGDSDFYIDLLFYHLKLRCFVVIELKAGDFDPGYVSKLNMYLNVVDDILRHPEDKPTIGLLLVKRKNKLVAEYALRGYTKLIGVAQWQAQITHSLPEFLKTSLPTIEEIEKEMSKGIGKAKK